VGAIDALRTEGTSILMSTHYIEEAERLADTVTIMAEGRAGRRRTAVRGASSPSTPGAARSFVV
jgi:ABC-type multidrug transport system ATPase subunit